ncbi:MAG: septal ring lytic transglycosylase RlpA family protein [Deltaproteobacteria bacterium]
MKIKLGLFSVLLLLFFVLPSVSSEQPMQYGNASWYGKAFHGKKTASGKYYDMNEFTGAHRNLPFGTKVKVRNLRNGKEVIVEVNDRGPFVRSRVIDLSRAAAKAIGIVNRGIVRVSIEVISYPYGLAPTPGSML